jgi:hypothetical protein
VGDVLGARAVAGSFGWVVDAIIGKLFLAGVSTRRLEPLADQLRGFGLSKAR